MTTEISTNVNASQIAKEMREMVSVEIKSRQHNLAELKDWINTIPNNDVKTLVSVGSLLVQMKKHQLVSLILSKCDDVSNDQHKDIDKEVLCELSRLRVWVNETNQAQLISIKSHVKTTDIQISLVVACMDREDHLIQCLESWMGLSLITEIVLVDYSSEIPLEMNSKIQKWINSGQIKLIRVEGESIFNLGKAYNIAFDFATNDKILKVDCDHLCLNGDWLDNLNSLSYDSHECFFIRGDWRFGHSMSGLLFCDKRDFVFYREDLTGWGFDDLDLAKRILETKPRIKEVIWSDARLFVSHINHDDKLRTSKYRVVDKAKTNYDNRLICHQPNVRINRFKYNSENKNTHVTRVTFDAAPVVNSVFCVTLAEKQDRWKLFSESIPSTRKFEAIDTRKDPLICEQYGLHVRPATLTYDLYFKGAPGAVGCYLSHYLIWQQIVKEQIPYTLITEDDADMTSLTNFLNNCLVNLSGYELVQLNKRFSYVKPEHRLMFHGTESYIVSLKGAEKLIEATHHPEYLEYVIHNEAPGVMEVKRTKRIKAKERTYLPHSIIAPADKFLSMCCDPKCDQAVKLKCINYPCVDINPLYSASDIDGGIGHLWQLPAENISKLIDTLLQPETY